MPDSPARLASSIPLVLMTLAATGPAQGGRYHGPVHLRDTQCGTDAALPPRSPTGWQTWWELHRLERLEPSLRSSNRRRLLQGRHAVRIQRALLATLRGEHERDVTPAVLVAAGRIGIDGPQLELLPALRRHLQSPKLRIAETAALALGLSRRRGALADLIPLAQGLGANRRTRAFACIGLGLLAQELASPEPTTRALHALVGVLDDALAGPLRDDDVPVAAITGLRLLDLGAAPADHREAALRALRAAHRRAGRSACDTRIAAHALVALARVLGSAGGNGRSTVRALCLATLREESRADPVMVSAAVIAFGELIAEHRAQGDVKLLRELARRGADPEVRGLAMMALAAHGESGDRTVLLHLFRHGDNASDRAWAACALGWSIRAGDAEAARVGNVLHDRLGTEPDAGVQSATALALGLCRHAPAEPDLRSLLAGQPILDHLCGYVGLALALLDAPDADRLFVGLWRVDRRPDVEIQTLAALGLLTRNLERIEAHLLQRMGGTGTNNFSRSCALATGLDYAARGSTIDALLTVLADPEQPKGARAAAAAALGSIGDPRPRHWSHPVTAVLPFRATVETLTDGWRGVLDL